MNNGFRKNITLDRASFCLNLTIVVLLGLLLASCTTPPTTTPRPDQWAKPLTTPHLHNLYEVDKNRLYRSAQPADNSLGDLKTLGIKTVLDLRYLHNDKNLLTGSDIQLRAVPMLAHDISEEELLMALVNIRQAKKPVLVHCQHGADRTGAVIAAYRIVEQGWSKHDAIQEMLHGGYGHHYLLFPNIREILEKMDVIAMKKRLK